MNKVLFNSAIRYLSRRPRSEREVEDYLIKKINKKPVRRKIQHVTLTPQPSPEGEEHYEQKIREIAEIMAKLKELKFLNDIEFARWWVENRTRSRPKGWRIVKLELQQKGIVRDIISSLSERIREESAEVFHGEFARDERQMALDIAQKRMKSLHGLDRQTVYRRLGGLLARRGFDMDIVRSVIDEILKKSV